jgi:SpoVK/Ycf46/Vps4 family AAA+-type ATPase
VRDTSRQSFILHPWQRVKRLFEKVQRSSSFFISLLQMTVAAESVLEGIILRPDLQKRLQGITIATARARQYGTNYRNFMLYGPPGTGKTMFAKKLALQV